MGARAKQGEGGHAVGCVGLAPIGVRVGEAANPGGPSPAALEPGVPAWVAGWGLGAEIASERELDELVGFGVEDGAALVEDIVSRRVDSEPKGRALVARVDLQFDFAVGGVRLWTHGFIVPRGAIGAKRAEAKGEYRVWALDERGSR